MFSIVKIAELNTNIRNSITGITIPDTELSQFGFADRQHSHEPSRKMLTKFSEVTILLYEVEFKLDVPSDGALFGPLANLRQRYGFP